MSPTRPYAKASNAGGISPTHCLSWSGVPGPTVPVITSARQWTQHTGIPEADLLGWQWLKVLHPDDREPTRKFWTDSVAGRGPYDVEYRVRRLDGEYRWFKTRGVPIRDSEGGIFKWFGTCTDITTSKQLEEKLRQANTRLDLAVRGSNVGIFEVDLRDGEYIGGRAHFINVWEQLGNQPPDSSVDSTAESTAWMASLHRDDRDRVLSEIRCAVGGRGERLPRRLSRASPGRFRSLDAGTRHHHPGSIR